MRMSLELDITINGRTVHKFIVGHGPTLDTGDTIYTIFDNDMKDLGMVNHRREDRALILAKKTIEMILHHYGQDGPKRK